ncbi:MAG: BamA/TamA family outer membrane protein [Cyanobacteria bacterium MAG CAR1_bin_15]|nr:BamA/TamA family outer membrane protein [Cyanobacteria bacterium MAG CAR1_bin_15]
MANSRQPRRLGKLFGALSTAGLFTVASHGPLLAQVEQPVDGLHMAAPMAEDPGLIRPAAPMALNGDTAQRQVAQALDNLKLAQAGPEEEEEDTGDPSVLPLEEEAPDDPGRERILPEEAPSGAVQDIAPEQEVLIAEVVIVGLEDHPERERLEIVAYDAMEVRPGATTTRSQLERDLTAVYATGWFSNVRVLPTDGPLGVRLEVTVTPNPVLTGVELEEQEVLLPDQVVQEAFAEDRGRTINLATMQRRMTRLEEWYAEQGYVLARVLGPTRITPEGVIILTVREGRVSDIEIEFANEEGETVDEEGEPVRGDTKRWVVTREMATRAGDRFNRRVLQKDLERLYGTGLFSDINVSLEPVPADPDVVALVLTIQEAKTGALSGGLGYSGTQGVTGQVDFSEDNLFGRAWRTTTQFSYGKTGTIDLAFYDPWIKDDPHRTAFRMNISIGEEFPPQFRREDGDNIRAVRYYHEADNPNPETKDRVFQAEDIDNPDKFVVHGDTIVVDNKDGLVRLVIRDDGEPVVIRDGYIYIIEESGTGDSDTISIREGKPVVIRDGEPVVIRDGEPVVIRPVVTPGDETVMTRLVTPDGKPVEIRDGEPVVIQPVVIRDGEPVVIRDGDTLEFSNGETVVIRDRNSVKGAFINRRTHNLFDYSNPDNTHNIRLRRTGINFQFVRPLNQGNPLAEDVKWTVSAGLTFQEVAIRVGSDREPRVWATGPSELEEKTPDDFFCVGHDCKSENILAGFRLGALYNTLDNGTNPTSGNFASFSTEQYISVGEGSPTFNRAQFSLAHFIPLNLLKIHPGCRPAPGEPEDCPQTLAFQVSGGALLGEDPPYESFCLGGSTSIRGFYECAIGPGSAFTEVSMEYRFPIIGILSGALFTDAGSVLGTQGSVTGNPGKLLEKPGSGFSYGAGVVLSTPLGPLRGEMAKGNHNKDWRFNFGVGWKF